MSAGRSAWLWSRGVVPYAEALEWQKQGVQQRCEQPDQPDLLMLLEHPPVYTLGRGSSLDFLRVPEDQVSLHRVGRGGEVTYHCPGQLVGYPILNLQHHQTDLHWYLRQLEAVIMAYHRKPLLHGVKHGD